MGDDHFNPADAVEVVRKLVEQGGIFAMVSGLGDVTHSAVWKYLEERGVPNLLFYDFCYDHLRAISTRNSSASRTPDFILLLLPPLRASAAIPRSPVAR